MPPQRPLLASMSGLRSDDRLHCGWQSRAANFSCGSGRAGHARDLGDGKPPSKLNQHASLLAQSLGCSGLQRERKCCASDTNLQQVHHSRIATESRTFRDAHLYAGANTGKDRAAPGSAARATYARMGSFYLSAPSNGCHAAAVNYLVRVTAKRLARRVENSSRAGATERRPRSQNFNSNVRAIE